MPLLEIRGLGVRYGATVALADVDLDVEAGEIHALVGENGAGKSTLLRVVAGVAQADAGSIDLARGARVDWAPQEPALAPDLTAAEWIFLGRERSWFGLLRRQQMDAAAEAALQELGSGVRARTRLATLLPAARKQVQLVRALLADPDLLLLDEPSAVLAAGEAETLFEALRRRRHSGRSTIYVTHRLDEVHALADRVTVLRDGRRVSTDPVAAVDSSELVRRMVGREVEVPRRLARRLGDVVLEVEGLAAGVSRAVSLRLRRGEIVGLAGLVGAGRSDVLEAIAGVRAVEAGRIALLAAPTLVAEDRATKGLIPTFGVRENIFLPASEAWLRQQVERDEARRWIGELAIRCGGPEAPVASLSGGNQQKVVLARALRRRPQLLLLDEPTAGVDVGAKAEIHDLIRRLAAEGAAILLASSDLPELLLLCDRIFALRGGRVAGEVSAAEASEARLGAMITGAEI